MKNNLGIILESIITCPKCEHKKKEAYTKCTQLLRPGWTTQQTNNAIGYVYSGVQPNKRISAVPIWSICAWSIFTEFQK